MGMKDFKQTLNDVTCDNCDGGKYCILKEILLHTSHPDTRIMVQIKCVDKFKYEQSEKEGKDIGWEDAFDRWVKDGYAKTFADVFDEELSFTKIYNAVMDKH